MSVVDYDKVFDGFMNTSSSSAIKDIYGMIPTCTHQQVMILNSLKMIAIKYDNKELLAFVDDYIKKCDVNKPLGFINSFSIKNLLKAYTTDEMLRGIKIQSNVNPGGDV